MGGDRVFVGGGDELRQGRISPAERARALSLFAGLVGRSFVPLSISEADFRAAAKFADRDDVAVRSGDALHLAVAMSHGATLCTLDRQIAAAGLVLGVDTRLI